MKNTPTRSLLPVAGAILALALLSAPPIAGAPAEDRSSDKPATTKTWAVFSGPGALPVVVKVADAHRKFTHCPWPRTCMAPCQFGAPPQVLCRFLNGQVRATTFACCCCGSGVNSYAPLGDVPLTPGKGHVP
jgi:hypothetical protein